MSGVLMGYPSMGGRRRRMRRRRGGFIPAALLAAHGVLKSLQPITNGQKLADAIGVSGAINRGLDRLGPVGSVLKGLGSFAKSTLGYGRRRHHRVVRKGPGRPRKVGRPKGSGRKKKRVVHRRR